MLYFVNDYCEGAHPKILEKLVETNMEKLSGYGTDKYTESAKKKIAEACACPEAEIVFLTGGTQTNQIVIDTMCRDYEGVVSATTGHVTCHEAGAIEFSGHKVLTCQTENAKIVASGLKQMLADFYADENHEHMVFPGMCYISQPTEFGTLYSKKELEDISAVCHEFKIPLYIDGARLGYALATKENDATLEDIARLSDVFYIGGTKVGALCGEAVVFTKKNMPAHYIAQVKQHGALNAKGRLNGIQFDVLFTDNLYTRISANAIECADIIKEELKKKNYKFYIDSPTNQIFVILENEQYKKLSEKVAVNFWEKYDDGHTVIRIATSWATTKEDVEELCKIL
ncbi:MAG: aminotransferase class I/II-fold pyridoxal phosphate-dependent enzyme [Treponema sp.]|nr:aminotransferase class I/II-fold pyridoxal phosphate-dependent enzyme [Spirochaetia bacterium]MDD7459222.1 aminotransferase class I/II-fold pyridoxal phosphate-dependent enzyme [Spirochaetales bacterium]MDY5812776.1 aminotransferase class I/II-fold pyridoxal phosphate-dependent enzyme [Treponema sp.]MEE1180635.1 aminotransferase class I/II-fold pyridoxal phosphate-dependent enzyme [Treponema sp.]